jgi:sulfur relay (sulfurtransferase) DsrF/TusC family protein
MEKLRINFNFIINYYVTILIVGGILSIIVTKDVHSVFVLALLVFFLDFLPTLYIILNYLEHNSKTEVIFFDDGVTILSKNNDKTIAKDQINQIYVFASPYIIEKRRLRFGVHESLFYARIKLKGEDDIILTSLLRPDLYENLEKIGADKIVRMKGLFNTIKK